MSRSMISGCILVCSVSLLSVSSDLARAADAPKLAAHLAPRVSRSDLRSGPTPPCNSGESNLTVNGLLHVPYDLYLLALDTNSSSGVSGITFSINYSSSGPGQGLRILGWESFAGSQLQRRNAQGEPWPAPGSGILLMFDPDERSAKSNSQDLDGRTTTVLGRFYVYAYSDDVFELSLNPEPTRGSDLMRDWVSSVRVFDGQKETAVVYPDHVGQVAFGTSASGRDPCTSIVRTGSQSSEVAYLKPEGVVVSAGSPNPFRDSIRWEVLSQEARNVTVGIFSVSGRLIREWPDAHLPAGNTTFAWDGVDSHGQRVSAGIYYLRVVGDSGYKAIRSAILIR